MPRIATAVGLRFGANLQRRRRQAELTQLGVAMRVDIHRTEIGDLERGHRLARLDTILKLSAGLGASPCVLLAGLEWLPGHYVEGKFYVEDEAILRVLGDRGDRR